MIHAWVGSSQLKNCVPQRHCGACLSSQTVRDNFQIHMFLKEAGAIRGLTGCWEGACAEYTPTSHRRDAVTAALCTSVKTCTSNSAAITDEQATCDNHYNQTLRH